MKNILLLALLCTSLSSVEANPLELNPSTTTVRVENTKKVAYRKRRKKGFFWRLFHKNDCGCPKH